jgi:hypothetical protein
VSKETVERALEQVSSDPELFAQLEAGVRALDGFNLSAEETRALLTHDYLTFRNIGVSASLLERAGWCTGE